MFKRYSKNPIISPKDIVSYHPEMIDVSSVFNPGGIQFDNKILSREEALKIIEFS